MALDNVPIESRGFTLTERGRAAIAERRTRGLARPHPRCSEACP